MGNFDTARTLIKNAIKENNNQEITGNLLQNVLINMLNNIGVGYIFGGVATPTTKPESITGTNAPVYYIANEVGTYVNFDGIIVNENEFAFLINGDDKKWKKAIVNIPIATASTDGLISKKDKAYIETLKPWLRDKLGDFESTEEFNNYLNILTYDTLENGQYIAYVGGVPFFVTYSKLYAKDKISVIWVEGSLLVTDSKISSNSDTDITIAYRYYKNETWGIWKSINDNNTARIKALEDKMPSVQNSFSGNNKNYIYSNGVTNDKNCVASCNWWIYSEDGRIYVRWKKWGADNNTHYDHDNESHQTLQFMIPYMGSDGGACYQDGLLPWQWGQRMKDCGEKFRFIQEELSTAEYVNLRYLNFSNGGRYDTPISKATSAKAGVMTAADKSKLDSLQIPIINFDEITSHWFNSEGALDIDKVSNAAPLYLVTIQRIGKDVVVGTLSAISDSLRHTIHLKFYTNYVLKTDGTFDTNEHKHELGYPKEYMCSAGFGYSYDDSDPDLCIPSGSFGRWYCPLDKQLNKIEQGFKNLKFAKVIYNLADTTFEEVAIDRYPSDSVDYVAGNTFKMFYTVGKDIPSNISSAKHGIWFGEFLSATAGYKRYKTESICGLSSEDLYNLVPPNEILKDYIFVDANKNIVNLIKFSGGINIEVNRTLDILLTVNDIIKLSK